MTEVPAFDPLVHSGEPNKFIKELIRRARSCHPYRVLVCGAFAPLEATRARADQRAREEGRHIADGFLRKMFSDIWPAGVLDTAHFDKFCEELLPGDGIWRAPYSTFLQHLLSRSNKLI